jgi:hypothetical protein
VKEESWRRLCEAIMQETDSNRLMELVTQLNQTLDQRETELRRIQASEGKDGEDDLDGKANLSKSC